MMVHPVQAVKLAGIWRPGTMEQLNFAKVRLSMRVIHTDRQS